jgi:hypothetical protein
VSLSIPKFVDEGPRNGSNFGIGTLGLLFERDIFRRRLNISSRASKGLFPPRSYG